MQRERFSSHLETHGPETYQSLLVKLVGEMRRNKTFTRTMQATPRFERYFKKDAAGVRNKDMEELGHAINTYAVAKKVAQLDSQSDQVAVARMKLVALIHDVGELEEGDVSFDEKKDTDEMLEAQSFEKNLGVYFPGLTPSEADLIKALYFDIALAKDKTKGEARYFHMIEKMGYVDTALQEFETQSDAVDWQWLCANVLHTQGKMVLAFVSEYPAAAAYLRQKKSAVRSMVDWARENAGVIKDCTQEDIAVWDDIVARI